MAEYIEKEAALKSVRDKLLICETLPDTIAKDASLFTLASMQDSLKTIPAANVRENVTGVWSRRRTWDHDGEIYCPFCDYEPLYDMKTNFYPNCGADMTGGNDG